MKTVTVGIPAYNEEANIDSIVRTMLAQHTEGFLITKIIVASDGSSDSTASIVRSIVDERIVLVDDPIRRGKNYRQNQLLGLADSDIMVLVDADIRFEDENAIAKLITPLCDGSTDFSGQWAIPEAPRTYLEAVLIAGHDFKQSVYRGIKNGNNIYTCVGHMRAFIKPLYKQLRFDELDSSGEDQYSYLQSRNLGFRYQVAAKIIAYFKLPSTLSDYIKYAKRIITTQRKFSQEINTKLVLTERRIPKYLLINKFVKNLYINPVKLPLYVLLHLTVSMLSKFETEKINAYYDVSKSTK